MSRERARALRKAFREQFATLAEQYIESQSDRYPEEYRQRRGEELLKQMNMAEATLSSGVLLWHYGQKVEAERLRHLDPQGDASTETRRLRERMEVADLAAQFPAKAQARNILVPRARAALAAGNVAQARVLFEAARTVGVYDGTVERDIEAALDLSVPHRRQAVEIEIAAQDEFELARRDVAEAKVVHKLGDLQEQARQSTRLKMADYKRQQEAEVLKQELGIELPSAVD